MLIDEVRDKLAALTGGNIVKVNTLPEACPGYLFRRDGWYGAAVPFTAKEPIEEHFSNAILHTTALSFDGHSFDAIAIECSTEETRHQFASLCAEFLDPGAHNANRNELIGNPRLWWRKWCEMLGNAIHEKQPYQVLGELLVLEHLLTTGKQADWAGPRGGTRDIMTANAAYEVKSSLSRYDTQITASSKYQFDPFGKPEYLVFIRFEPQLGGDSLAQAVNRLSAIGCNRDLLLKLIKKQGISEGNQAYKTSYRVLEMREYVVDSSFPYITDASFAGGHAPERVKQFVYTLDLTGIPYTAIDI